MYLIVFFPLTSEPEPQIPAHIRKSLLLVPQCWIYIDILRNHLQEVRNPHPQAEKPQQQPPRVHITYPSPPRSFFISAIESVILWTWRIQSIQLANEMEVNLKKSIFLLLKQGFSRWHASRGFLYYESTSLEKLAHLWMMYMQPWKADHYSKMVKSSTVRTALGKAGRLPSYDKKFVLSTCYPFFSITLELFMDVFLQVPRIETDDLIIFRKILDIYLHNSRDLLNLIEDVERSYRSGDSETVKCKTPCLCLLVLIYYLTICLGGSARIYLQSYNRSRFER